MPVITVGTKRILYIHVPKTGGTSIEALLGSYGGRISSHARPRAAGLPCTPQHFHGDVLRQVFGFTEDGVSAHDFDFVFMTVRDPLARMLSEYRHQRTLRPNKSAKRLRRRLNVMPGAAQMLEFGSWSRYAIRRARSNPYFADNHLRPQHEFCVWNPTVFRIEDGLHRVKTHLDELLGVPGELPAEPKMVSTDRSGAVADLGSRSERLIREFYAGDYTSFGY